MSRELRRRVEVLHLRRANATPPPPIPVVFAKEGETPPEARQRAGLSPTALCIVMKVTDASVPRV